jgi:hypothetical protein
MARLKGFERDQFIRRIHRRFKQNPAMAYRPAPTALRFHQSNAAFRWLLGGNRSGKSRSAAQEVLWYATGTHPYKKINTPNVGWYSTENWEMVGTVLWKTLEPLLKGWTYEIPSWVNKGRGIPYSVKLKVRGGWSEILFKSYEQGREAYQGVERRWICNDEQFPESVFQEQTSRIGPGAPLDFWGAMTPIDPQPWLEEDLNVETPENWDIFEMPLDENRISAGGVIDDAYIDGVIQGWPAEMRDTRRKGKWSSFLGAVFKNFKREIHVKDEKFERQLIQFVGDKIHGKYDSCGGIDFGGNNPFVYLIVVKLPDDHWYVLDEYYWDYRTMGVRLMKDHAEHILELNSAWGVHPKNIWADHDKQDSYELEDAGLYVLPADKGLSSSQSTLAETGIKASKGKQRLIETMQTLIGPGLVTGMPRMMVAKRCKNLIRQIISNRWAIGTEIRDAKDLPIKVDDHAVDAWEYAIHSERGTMRPANLVIDTTGEFRDKTQQYLDELKDEYGLET